MNINQWLDSGALVRLAELIAVNRGSMVVEGNVGKVVPVGTNRYSRVGLTIAEAFELTYLRGMFDILAHGQTAPVMEAVKARIEREIRGEIIEIATPEMVQRILTR